MKKATTAFLKEFKAFAIKGNVISMAVGIMIGGAFQSIINSLINDVIAPVIGIFVRQNFDNLELHLWGSVIRYGAFMTALLNFLIMAMVIFLFVRAMNRAEQYYHKITHKEEQLEPALEPAESPARTCPYCYSTVHQLAIRCAACTSRFE